MNSGQNMFSANYGLKNFVTTPMNNTEDDFLKPSPSHAMSFSNQLDCGLKMDKMI